MTVSNFFEAVQLPNLLTNSNSSAANADKDAGARTPAWVRTLAGRANTCGGADASEGTGCPRGLGRQ